LVKKLGKILKIRKKKLPKIWKNSFEKNWKFGKIPNIRKNKKKIGKILRKIWGKN